MRNLLFVVAVCAAFGAAPALAQDGNHSPQCSAKTMLITEPGNETAIIEVNPILIGPACSDEDGDILTLTAVSSPAVLVVDKQGNSKNRLRISNTLQLNASVTIWFSVSDGNGGTTQSSVTLVRQDASN